MADRITFTLDLGHFDREIGAGIAKARLAAQTVVDAGARIAEQAARANAPVLESTSRTDQNAPVPGLLRDSITVGSGPGGTVTVGPRGQRVRLYAGKEEARARFMQTARDAAERALERVAADQFATVFREF